MTRLSADPASWLWIIALLVAVIALLGIAIWSIKRHKDPHLQLDTDAPFTSVFGDQLTRALEDPSTINWWLVAAVLIAFAVLTWLVRRWFLKR